MKRTSAHFIWTFFVLLSAATAQEEEDSDFQKYTGLFAQKCSKCHTIGGGDRVGPDLKEVTKKRDREWLVGFIRTPSQYLDTDPTAKKLLVQYGGVRMTDLGLTREDAEGLLHYIELASEGGGGSAELAAPLEKRDLVQEVQGPDEGRGISWMGLFLIPVLLALCAGSWSLQWTRTAQVIFVITLLVAYGTFFGRHHRAFGDHQGYEPEQPIAFSHKMHAGNLGISCLYCHHAAEKGPEAGVPSINICMNCHGIVRNQKGKEGTSPELQKLYSAWETRNTDHPKSIEWIRVHRLSDFVTFHHKAHVQNGILCQTCHGPVQEMERMRQASTLSMGWCVNCHRHKGFDPPTHWKRSEATLDCSACHQ